MIRVLLADDQALVRGALGALLDLEEDLTVVAEAGDGEELLKAAAAHQPDVCLVDVQMPGMDGITATRTLVATHPGVKVLVVTTFNRPGYLRAALEAGASGFVVKDSPAADLAQAVRRVAAGEVVVDQALAAASLATGPNPLTAREQEVLRLAADGLGDADIAARLHLSRGTVRNHLSSAIGKLHADNRLRAARIAAEQGWI